MPELTEMEKLIQINNDIFPIIAQQETYFGINGKYCQCLETEGTATKFKTLPGEKAVISVDLTDKSKSVCVHEKMTVRDGQELFGYMVYGIEPIPVEEQDEFSGDKRYVLLKDSAEGAW